MPGLAYNLIGSQVAGALGPTAAKAFQATNKVLNAPLNIAQAANTAKNIKYNYKNAPQENQYHRKLAAEVENDREKRAVKIKRALAKSAPYVVAGTLLGTYGYQAVKDKGLTKPVVDAINGIPQDSLKRIKNKSKILSGAVKGGINAMKEGNKIVIKKSSPSAFGSAVNGFAWGAGALGAHMLGREYLKYKKEKNADKIAEKSYNRVQPAKVKQYKMAEKIIKNHKSKKENEQEKKASVDWDRVLEYGVKSPAATAIPVFLARKAANSIFSDPPKKAARAIYSAASKHKKKKEKEQNNNGVEKTASINGSRLLRSSKDAISRFGREYGQQIAQQTAKALTTAAVTAPLVFTEELIRQSSRNKKFKKEQEERRKRYGENRPYRNYNKNMTRTEEGELRGRDFNGSQREKNS